MSLSLPPVWIDAHALGARVLRNDEDPWQQPGEFGLFQRELVGWLGVDIVDIDVLAALKSWQQRSTGPVDTVRAMEDLLDDGALHLRIKEALSAAAGACNGKVLVLRVPGPGCLAQQLADTADEDDLEDLVTGLAGLLRQIHHPAIACLAVEEWDAAALAFYGPLHNLARHYGLPLVLILHGAGEVQGDFAGVYRGTPAAGEGCILPGAFWADSEAAPATAEQPCFAHVPASLHPDELMGGMARLR